MDDRKLSPSIHCIESYICLKSAIEMKDIDNKYRISMVIMSILVFMSTVFIKQHVILDLFGAVIVAEAGRLLMEFLYAIGIPRLKNKKASEGVLCEN